MAGARGDLDSGYYLQHFHEVLQFVSTHYQHCLTAASQQFLQDFAALSTAAQQLLVRMLNRKGSVFADSELNYAEIGAVAPLFNELCAAGFIAPLSDTELSDFWLRASKDTLWQLLQLAEANIGAGSGAKKSHTKPQLLRIALQLEVEWLVLLAQLPQRYVVLRRQDTLNYLYFLYFGRIEANLSLFTLRDLGIRQSGQFKQQFKPRFSDLAQAQLAYALACAKQQLYALGKQLKNQPEDAANLLQPWLTQVQQWPHSDDATLQLKRSERCYSLGKLAEQYLLDELAIAFYQLSNGFPASERLVRLYFSRGQTDKCQQYLQQLLDDPSCDEEWLFADDFYQRKFAGDNRPKRSQLSQLLRDAALIGIDELYAGKAEQGLMAHYAANGYTVFHGENNLWLALFGLWFWHEL
ncbi:MAG: DNA polymerase III subunit epsilon, partial [Rheinheimera sp.]|nr:DNA polymerase III subunit epsilon [Rheinheimera sp.]